MNPPIFANGSDEDSRSRRGQILRVSLVGFDAKTAKCIAMNLRVRWPDCAFTHLAADSRLEQIATDRSQVIFLSTTDGRSLGLIKKLASSSEALIFAIAEEPDDNELIEVLEAGADDYIAAQVSAPELVARVSAALRRLQPSDEHEEAQLLCADLRVNPLTHEVFLADQPLHLTPTEFKVLYHLVKNKERLVAHETLQGLIWGSDSKFYGDNLRKYIQRLRRKLEGCQSPHVRIVTVPATGYRLMAVA